MWLPAHIAHPVRFQESAGSVAREGIGVVGAEGGIDGEVACLFVIYTICQELYISVFFNLHNVPLRKSFHFRDL